MAGRRKDDRTGTNPVATTDSQQLGLGRCWTTSLVILLIIDEETALNSLQDSQNPEKPGAFAPAELFISLQKAISLEPRKKPLPVSMGDERRKVNDRLPTAVFGRPTEGRQDWDKSGCDDGLPTIGIGSMLDDLFGDLAYHRRRNSLEFPSRFSKPREARCLRASGALH